MRKVPQNIIIRMPNWLGDLVMATPILADLRRAYPQASLTAMCPHALSPLLLGNPNLTEIFSFSKPNGFLRKPETQNLCERLSQGKYDLGILLPNSFSSAWWFFRTRVKRRLGYTGECRRFLLTDPVPFPKERGKEHLVTTYKRLLAPLDIEVSDTSPELFVTPQEQRAATTLLREYHVPAGAKIVGINAGSAYGPAKCWLPSRFRQLTERLIQDPNTYVIFFGDSAGTKLIQSITDSLPPQVINLSGQTTIREFIALTQQCHLFITNDSGPMHVAAALKTPLLALFGSTNEIATGPYNHGEIIHKRVDCSPCYKRVCPIDFRCMKRIEVDEVYQKAMQMLTT